MPEKLHKRKRVWVREYQEFGNIHNEKFVSRRKILAPAHSSEEKELMFIVDWQQNDKTL